MHEESASRVAYRRMMYLYVRTCNPRPTFPKLGKGLDQRLYAKEVEEAMR
jgi:hypothetical protein